MIHRTGNLFTTQAPAIGHGVNIDGLMAHGIAVEFKQRFPEMHRAYVALCRERKLHAGGFFPWKHNDLWVLNLASQDRPGRNARLEWLETSVTLGMRHILTEGIDTLALPRIGCGIGGLRWEDVEPALKSIEKKTGGTIEMWTL